MMRFVLSAIIVAVIALGSFDPGRAGDRKFYPDDPIARDPENQNASDVDEIDVSQGYDFVENSFLSAGDHSDIRALNVNTIDEVPDSSWFTNRAGRRPLTKADFTTGPNRGSGPAGEWTVISGKFEGRAPGFTIRDSAGQIYFVKFDPPSNPEMATGAEVISTKFFHAFGYHVPENYIATFRRETLSIAEGTMLRERETKRPMKDRDIDMLLRRVARQPDGTYRVIASKALDGKAIGHFRYYGTRPDDPNDIFDHEHRRELRGMAVFAAWLNHDDSRSINTLDALVTDGGRTVLRHNLLDFGSTLGSGTIQAQSTRAGNEYIWDSRPTLISMLTLGLYVRPWIRVPYPDLPAVGRFEGTFFDPTRWKPEYPNPAFENARPEDRFWAARIVAAIPDDAIPAIVASGQYSDPKVSEYIARTLVTRKQKVLKTWLNGTNPVVDPVLNDRGQLTFENASVRAATAEAADHYTIQWSTFDNVTHAHQNVGDEQTVTSTSGQAPASLLSTQSEFVAARVRAFHPQYPEWATPVTIYFRRSAGGWTLVGLERG